MIPDRRTPSAAEVAFIAKHLLPIDPLQIYEQSQIEDALIQSMQNLTDREIGVIWMRFGFGGEDKNLREIGAIIGRSGERVRSIEAKAIRKLRGTLSPVRLSVDSWLDREPWWRF